jgi:hypothetical protein
MKNIATNKTEDGNDQYCGALPKSLNMWIRKTSIARQRPRLLNAFTRQFRNLKERDCATVTERYHVLPPLPSPRFAPHCALLGCAVKLDGATVSKDHVTSVTSRKTIHGAAFSACRIPAFIGETEGSAALAVKYEQF